MAQSRKRASAEFRESRAQPSPTIPLRFPAPGIGSYFARNDEQTRDEIAKSKRERERERARWARIPPTIPSGCVWQRAKGPFHRFALFSARLFARPARNQPLHCPRGQYIYHEERPTHSSTHPPFLPVSRNFRKFVSLFCAPLPIITSNDSPFSSRKFRDNWE